MFDRSGDHGGSEVPAIGIYGQSQMRHGTPHRCITEPPAPKTLASAVDGDPPSWRFALISIIAARRVRRDMSQFRIERGCRTRREPFDPGRAARIDRENA